MCDHPAFEATVDVARLTDGESDAVTAYSADVRVQCWECRMPFEFIGLPAGLHPAKPTVSGDGTELRAPIRPSREVEAAGGVH